MKLGRLTPIGVAGPLSYSVFASVAKQSRLLDVMLDCCVAALLAKTIGVFSGAGVPRFARNDERVRQ